MDVGLVCEACRTFNPMGERACARCGQALSLDAVLGSALRAAPAAASASMAAPAAARPPGDRKSARGHHDTEPAEVGDGVPFTTTPGASRVCVACGAPLNPSFRFCGTCGAPTEEATRPSPLTPVASAQAAAPAASVIAASMAARSAPLSGDKSGKKTLFFGAMQASRAKLTLIKGDGLDGISFTLAGEDHMAGRGEDVPLMFAEDPFMSPVHANFFYRKGKLVVRDESSANGVYIRIKGSVPMGLDDRFLIGEQVIEVRGTRGAEEAAGDGTYFYASPNRSTFRVIQLLRGGDTGLAFQATSDVVSLGREGNDVNFPDDPFISGHHAQVSYVNGSLSLTDLGSKNGTFLRLGRESVLEHGDYVFMGQQLLRVEIV